MPVDTKKARKYLKKYGAKIHSGSRNVPTYAQYVQKGWNKDSRTKSVTRSLKNAGLTDSDLAKFR